MRRLWGALTSLNKAAYLALILKLTQPFTFLLDAFFFYLSRRPRTTGKFPPILFLVGPPRSGSTITYQLLVQKLACAYLSNWHGVFPSFAYRVYRHPAPSSLKNYYGYTPKMADVYEGNEFFRELPSLSDVREIRIYFSKWIARINPTGLPMIIKNVGMYPEISKVAQALPESCFLAVKRNLAGNIASELRAYHELGTFNPIPEELRQISIHQDPVDFACKQITSIYQDIDRQLNELNPERVLMWPFEKVTKDPENSMEEILAYFAIPFTNRTQNKIPLPAKPPVKPLRQEERDRITDYTRSVQKSSV